MHLRPCAGSAQVDGRVLGPPGLDNLGFGSLHSFHLLVLLVLLVALTYMDHHAGGGVGGRVQFILPPWGQKKQLQGN